MGARWVYHGGRAGGVASAAVRRDAIEVEGLRVACVVGVWAEERDREQVVRVDLRLGLSLAAAGRSASIHDTVDYDRVATEVAALLGFRRYRLLETAAEELAAMLLGGHPRVDEVELRLAKPDALRGRAEAAAVVVTRGRDDFPRRSRATTFGEEEELLETAEARVVLLHVGPGQRLPPRRGPALAWLVRGSLRRGGEVLAPHRPLEPWDDGDDAPCNDGDAVATLLCCEHPLDPAGGRA